MGIYDGPSLPAMTAEEVVREFVSRPRTGPCPDFEGEFICMFCWRATSDRPDQDIADPSGHEPRCLWRRAHESLQAESEK